MRVPRLALIAAIVGPALASTPAHAADDGLAWRLGDEIQEFALEADSAQTSVPKDHKYGQYSVVLDPRRFVCNSDFADNRLARCRGRLGELGELVWFYGLSLPGGKDEKRTVKVTDTFALHATVTVEGDDEITSGTEITQLKATLQVKDGDNTGTLVVDRKFDRKRGVIVEARYDLAMTWKDTSPTRHVGKIVYKGKFDADSKEQLVDTVEGISHGGGSLKDGIASRLKSPYRDKILNDYGDIAIGTLALLRSGATASELDESLGYLAKTPPKDVIDASLYLLCLEATTLRRESVPPATGGRTVARFRKEAARGVIKSEMDKTVRALLGARKKGAGFWSWDVKVQSDLEYTQLALLALHAAATSGVSVDPGIWKEVADRLLAAQETEGPAQDLGHIVWRGSPSWDPAKTGSHARGWTFCIDQPLPDSEGPATASAVTALVFAREGMRRAGKLDADMDTKTSKALDDGLAWIVRNWTEAQNRQFSTHRNLDKHLYYLYSLEQAMEACGIERIDAHVWWREGCAQILAEGVDRHYGQSNTLSVKDTALAVLFLNRATLPGSLVQKKVRIVSGEKDPMAWDQVFIEGTGHVHMQELLAELAEASPERAKYVKWADKGLELLDEEVRPRLLPALIPLLGADADVKGFAARALKVTTGASGEPQARAFLEKFESVTAAAEARNYAGIPTVSALLGDRNATGQLKRVAAFALRRLHAVEALGELIEQLNDKDPATRKVILAVVVDLAGGEKCPFDPAAGEPERQRQQVAWKAWWDSSHVAAVAATVAPRAVEALGLDSARAAAAETKLRDLGLQSVRALIEGLRQPRTKDKAHALLKEITKADIPPEPEAWLAWAEKNAPAK
jgi:hypothetical protein